VYAIVDIETTGGHAASGCITEIAIILSDGQQVEGGFHTLVNPGCSIPRYISALTGINDDMVADAPSFEQIAPHVFNLLSNRVFVAHNVNFDYSFILQHLQRSGIHWQVPKLCTVRLSRKLFPGHRSYSLGNICMALSIPIQNRHRAAGDAEATANLFHQLVASDQSGIIQGMLRRGSREGYLPLHLPVSDIEQLPHAAGVYYFHDQKQKVIYVGKAKNLKKRVSSHFSNNSPSRKKQELMRNVHRISYALTGSEFTASILESLEIRRHWPRYNTSQKTFEFGYGIILFEDVQGRKRLGIDRLRRNSRPVGRFSLLTDAHRNLWRMVREYGLCPSLCFLTRDAQCEQCMGACSGQEDISAYNLRVEQSLSLLEQEQPSFAIREKGREEGECTWLLMEQGQFYGMGFLPDRQQVQSCEQLKEMLTPFTGNEFVRGIMLSYASQNPVHRFS
jgi:DNA polymerase-3 subunit epsilon